MRNKSKAKVLFYCSAVCTNDVKQTFEVYNVSVLPLFLCCKTCNQEDNKMNMLKSFFKHVGEADKNIWGYVML